MHGVSEKAKSKAGKGKEQDNQIDNPKLAGLSPAWLLGSSTVPQICSSIRGLGLSWNFVIGLHKIIGTLHSVAQWLR